jgi:hypothetical protein
MHTQQLRRRNRDGSEATPNGTCEKYVSFTLTRNIIENEKVSDLFLEWLKVTLVRNGYCNSGHPPLSVGLMPEGVAQREVEGKPE